MNEELLLRINTALQNLTINLNKTKERRRDDVDYTPEAVLSLVDEILIGADNAKAAGDSNAVHFFLSVSCVLLDYAQLVRSIDRLTSDLKRVNEPNPVENSEQVTDE